MWGRSSGRRKQKLRKLLSAMTNYGVRLSPLRGSLQSDVSSIVFRSLTTIPHMANSEVVSPDFFRFFLVSVRADRVDFQVFWIAIPILLLAFLQMSIHRVEEGCVTVFSSFIISF